MAMARHGFRSNRPGQQAGADCGMSKGERIRNRMESASVTLIEDVFLRDRWTPRLRDQVADFFEILVMDEIAKRGLRHGA